MNTSKYMNIAIKEAFKALTEDEIPVGAVIVKNNKIIGKGYNQKEKKKNVTAHAEIMAIQQASKYLNNWRLDDCVMYVTLEPCPMCASAIQQARINKIYYGISRNNQNNHKIIDQIFSTTDNNKAVNTVINCALPECQKIIQNYFLEKRKK